MKKLSVLTTLATSGLIGLAFAVVILGVSPVVHAITTTTTVTGYNFPNATNSVNAFWPLVVPLFFAEIFGSILIYLGRGGDFFVSLFLFGIALGSSIGTLVGTIPIGMTIIAWVLLGLWWWSGGQGEGQGASGDTSNLRMPKGW